MTEAEAAQLEELVFEGKTNDRLTDLAWVAHFTGLKKLDLRYHHLTDLDPLSGLKDLEKLVLGAPNGFAYDSATDFSGLSGMDSLQDLNLVRHEISDLSGLVDALEDLPNLVALQLQRNGIDEVDPLSALTGLKFLGLQDNEIVDITPLVQMSGLEQINLSFNKIYDISPFEGITIPSNGHIYLDGQQVKMSDAFVYQKTTKPVLYLNGNQVPVTSTSDGYEPLGVFAEDWGFTTEGDKTLTWEKDTPFDTQPFSGTITQRINPLNYVTPEEPTVETCVDGEPVTITRPGGPSTVDYF